MRSLQEFWNDKEMCANVKSYLDEFIQTEGVVKLFAKESILGIAEAKELVDKAWEKMENLFTPPPPQITHNEAR